jgi:hypothetical protein
VDGPSELRRHAAKCRFLADFTVNDCDRKLLHQSAADFDAEADRLEADPSSARTAAKPESS